MLAYKVTVMDAASVRHAYRRWAPVYDVTFGQIAEAGRKHAVKIINRKRGRVLEVGVGTGLSLPCYGGHLTITGIDLSPEMLAKAAGRVERKSLDNVAGLHEMDAGALAFPDESFDTVVAMYVLTVVPEPELLRLELRQQVRVGDLVEQRRQPVVHQGLSVGARRGRDRAVLAGGDDVARGGGVIVSHGRGRGKGERRRGERGDPGHPRHATPEAGAVRHTFGPGLLTDGH